MYCDYHEEDMCDDECLECDRSCQRKRDLQASEKLKEDMVRLKDCELATEIRNTLSKTLSLSTEVLDKLVVDLLSETFKSAQDQLSRCLNTLARQMAVEYIEVKAKKELDAVFAKAMDESILVLLKNEKAQEIKVREIILNKTKKFFDGQSSNSRRSTSESFDQAIERAVSAKVSVALNEIKEESIDKFNKEIMKKMMLGMVGEIQNDKRLLAVMNIE